MANTGDRTMDFNMTNTSGGYERFHETGALTQSFDSQASFASSFRGRNTAMTTDELRKARESRAADALRMKDEQLRILSEQNASLLKTLEKVR